MKKIILIITFVIVLIYGLLAIDKEKNDIVVLSDNAQAEETSNKSKIKQVLVEVISKSPELFIENEPDDNGSVYGKGFDTCNDMIIDQVTEMAFGQHGILYTGEVTCYRDKENKIKY
ncbi:MAG: hypothetical protein QM504_15410 [Pseudomonadota bacterium]